MPYVFFPYNRMVSAICNLRKEKSMKRLLKFYVKFIGKVFYLGVAAMAAIHTANDLLHPEDWD